VTVIGMLSQPGTSLSLAEVSRRLQVNKSTCYSMMTALTRAGWVTRDPIKKAYVIGPAMIEISRNATNSFPAMRIAHPAMTQLAFNLGVNCSAVRATEGRLVTIEQVKDLRASRDPFMPEIPFPMRAPFGAYFIAHASSSVFEQWTVNASPEQRAYLQQALQQCRTSGFLVGGRATHEQRSEASRRGNGSIEKTLDSLADIILDADEGHYFLSWESDGRYEVDTIGSPVIGRNGEVDLVLTLSGFDDFVTGAAIDQMATALCTVTASLTSALGGNDSAQSFYSQTLSSIS
jgi:DNA-binding IclR family transcriptional regulator